MVSNERNIFEKSSNLFTIVELLGSIKFLEEFSEVILQCEMVIASKKTYFLTSFAAERSF